MKGRMKGAVFAVLSSILVYQYYHHEPQPAYQNQKSYDYFSEDYYAARHLFRQMSKKKRLETHVLALDDPNHELDDLSIDISIVPGNDKKLLIHICGTHGVEGFAGSGIQSALLDDQEEEEGTGMDDDDSTQRPPTVVFVHGLNPYGFAKLRRWNENNVDLNRNLLTPSMFQHKRHSRPQCLWLR